MRTPLWRRHEVVHVVMLWLLFFLLLPSSQVELLAGKFISRTKLNREQDMIVARFDK